MRLDELSRAIETTYRVTERREVWPQFGQASVGIATFASPQFLAYGNGLLVQGEDEVPEVYTAVFPTADVLEHLRSRALPGSVLVCHYPVRFDGLQGLYAMPRSELIRLQERALSLYILHTPLAFGERISTPRALARALRVEVEGTFHSASNLVGCYGTVQVNQGIHLDFNFMDMVQRVEQELEITNSQVLEHVEKAVGRVALIPGDGADPEMLVLADELGCHTYITGILDTTINDTLIRLRSQAFLEHARVRGINLIGASFYATAAPGLRVLATWFQSLGLSATFIPDKPELPGFLAG